MKDVIILRSAKDQIRRFESLRQYIEDNFGDLGHHEVVGLLEILKQEIINEALE